MTICSHVCRSQSVCHVHCCMTLLQLQLLGFPSYEKFTWWGVVESITTMLKIYYVSEKEVCYPRLSGKVISWSKGVLKVHILNEPGAWNIGFYNHSHCFSINGIQFTASILIECQKTWHSQEKWLWNFSVFLMFFTFLMILPGTGSL